MRKCINLHSLSSFPTIFHVHIIPLYKLKLVFLIKRYPIHNLWSFITLKVQSTKIKHKENPSWCETKDAGVRLYCSKDSCCNHKEKLNMKLHKYKLSVLGRRQILSLSQNEILIYLAVTNEMEMWDCWWENRLFQKAQSESTVAR